MGASSVTGTGHGSVEGPYRGDINRIVKILKQDVDLPAFVVDDNKIRLQAAGGDDSGLVAHLADTGNPHNTTALQVGADLLGSAAEVQQNLTNHETDILIHFTEASIDHDNIQNNGVNSHAQIDDHLADTDNPHFVTLEQVRSENNQINGPIDANQQKITNLPTPTENTDAVTKSYVDGLVTGLSILDSVRVATTADLSANYNPVTLKLTATGNGAISVDNTPLSSTNRVLVKDQNSATQNGVYEVTTVGDGDNPWVLTRASDFDENSEVSNGTFVFVTEGDDNVGTGWVVTTPNPIVIDATEIYWTQFSSSGSVQAGDGLVQDGNNFDVNVDDATIEINANILRVKDSGITDGKLDKTNIPLSGFGAAVATVDLGGQRIENLDSPVNPTDAVNKAYVDGAASGGIVTTKVSNYSASAGDIILCDTSGGAFVVTLPPASLNGNSKIVVKKITEDGYAVSVDANGGEKIDNKLVVVIDGPYDAIQFISDGSNWWII